ncbi:MAG TPA: RNase adapter RapZ [Candidatus Limnocylindrales bacterium]|nr:RNase adapter RapZ [Candidatus Limnocylindrales bacterium]
MTVDERRPARRSARALTDRPEAAPSTEPAAADGGSDLDGSALDRMRESGAGSLPESASHVVIITGLSGGGKTAAAKLFEDLGYTVVDNLPGELLPDLAELVSSDPERFAKVAIVLDVRSGDTPLAFAAMRGALEGRGIRPQVFFLDAADDVLVRRFSETRHRHPLSSGEGLVSSITAERRLLDPVRADADVVLDTSNLSLRELRERLFSQIGGDVDPDRLAVQLISFGFKHGVPIEADLVFDVRFMTNPFYIDELRPLSGLTDEVRTFVLDQPPATRFLTFLRDFLDFAVPNYVSEGKTRLTIGIGCTGGYHRSIVIAEELATWLRERDFGPVSVFHRELERT